MSFDTEFAGPADWAAQYRHLRWQVVPAKLPSEHKSWKRPALSSWREHEGALVDDGTFQSWYGHGGQFFSRPNMGLITGAVSGVFILDVDLQKSGSASLWLQALRDQYLEGGDFQTPCQRTGGGGLQYVFRAPAGWRAPTFKSELGIDVRGEGGFAMLPPSLHESGQCYEWLRGRAPWEMPVIEAPAFLIEAINKINASEQFLHGAEPEDLAPQGMPAGTRNGFGSITDGRENYMARLVWAAVVDLYRESPIMPSPEVLTERMREAFTRYERNVKSRIPEPGTPNHILLEKEGRGITAFADKWKSALKQWEGKVRESSAHLPRYKEMFAAPVKFNPETGEILEEVLSEPEANIFEILDIGQIRALPDPRWLVDGLLIENSLGFIYGPPGSGKSFVAIDICLHIATAQPDWWGRKIQRCGPIFYISTEGVSDLKFRIKAWEVARQFDATDAPFYLMRQSTNFMDPDSVQKLHRTVASMAERASHPPVLIVVDTVSRVLPGADENLQKDMTMFVAACDSLREAWGATVIGVHHTSRAGNLRGSTVLDGAGDLLLAVEREEGSENAQLYVKKLKAGQDGFRIPFKLVKTPIGDVRGTESLVATPSEATPVPTTSDWPDRLTSSAMLLAVHRAWEAGRPWSPYPQAKREGRYVVDQLSRPFEMDPDLVERVVNHWLSTNVLRYEIYDAASKRKGLKVVDPSGLSASQEDGF